MFLFQSASSFVKMKKINASFKILQISQILIYNYTMMTIQALWLNFSTEFQVYRLDL